MKPQPSAWGFFYAINLTMCIYIHIVYDMGYEWDKAKERSNRAKHGVSFADATFVFNDELALTKEDMDAEGEQRWITLGVTHDGCLVVVWTDRSFGSIRIISARKATKHESKIYWKGVQR